MTAAGWTPLRLADGAEALAAIRAAPPSVVVLDLMLPGLAGLSVCRAVRAFSPVPIIVVTAQVQEIDRLLGLESGADDDVCKPFSPRELMARLKVQLRRLAPREAPPIVVDAPARQASVRGQALELTPTEFIWFRDESRLDERWTTDTDTVTGIRYGQSRLVYLLTSEDTFSAGEDFAYALKNNGRAVLVGETTGGGAHPGNLRRLSAHFEMNVPTGRTISPVTQTDWEGVGVVPDVKVPARKALAVAQVALLKKLLPAETDPEWQRKIRDRIGQLD